MKIIATREIDDLGRVLIPIELRREKMWTKGDLLTFYKCDNIIIIDVCEKAKVPICTVCGRVGGEMLCDDCTKVRIEEIGGA